MRFLELVLESWPKKFNNQDKIYHLLSDTIDAGPFDGGCVIFAQALQKIYSGDIVVLVGTPNKNSKNPIALHAMLSTGGKLIDADGAATPKLAISRFIKNELVYSGGTVYSVRPIEPDDLPDAPRDDRLAQDIANLLQEH